MMKRVSTTNLRDEMLDPPFLFNSEFLTFFLCFSEADVDGKQYVPYRVGAGFVSIMS